MCWHYDFLRKTLELSFILSRSAVIQLLFNLLDQVDFLSQPFVSKMFCFITHDTSERVTTGEGEE